MCLILPKQNKSDCICFLIFVFTFQFLWVLSLLQGLEHAICRINIFDWTFQDIFLWESMNSPASSLAVSAAAAFKMESDRKHLHVLHPLIAAAPPSLVQESKVRLQCHILSTRERYSPQSIDSQKQSIFSAFCPGEGAWKMFFRDTLTQQLNWVFPEINKIWIIPFWIWTIPGKQLNLFVDLSRLENYGVQITHNEFLLWWSAKTKENLTFLSLIQKH